MADVIRAYCRYLDGFVGVSGVRTPLSLVAWAGGTDALCRMVVGDGTAVGPPAVDSLVVSSVGQASSGGVPQCAPVNVVVDSACSLFATSVLKGPQVLVGPNGGLSVGRGSKYVRNQAKRDEKKRRQQEGRVRSTRQSQPEPQGEEEIALQRSLKKKWIMENEMVTRKLEYELENFDQVVVKKLVHELGEMEKESVKARAEVDRIEREKKDGTLDARHKATKALLDGQLSGKYSLVAPKHVIGYAQTLHTATSSPSGSSGAGKTVWSGSGASKVSRNSSQTSREFELERQLERQTKDSELEKTKMEREIKAMKGEMAVLRRELEDERSDGGRRDFFSIPDDTFLYGSRKYRK